MKYKLLKAVDVAGLSFLSPVIRLCYGEEPAVQAQKIGQLIVVPCIAILLFIGLWFVISEKIQTKSGKLPDPAETLGAYGDVMTFHQREVDKQDAYALEGPERDRALAQAREQLATIEPQVATTNDAVVAAKAAHVAALAKSVAPLQAKYDTLKTKYTAAQEGRKATLARHAAVLTSGDVEGHQHYLQRVKEHEAGVATEREELSALKSTITERTSKKSKEIAAALRAQTQIAEEQQYLQKMIENLSTANRAVRVEEGAAGIAASTAAFYATSGEGAYQQARSIAKAEERLGKMEESEYAKPWTLPNQIVRSLACVFVGFLIGSVIAIPLGILCGLSTTFMAALTPFIAIFKPVSPIVWLPIALILVGGFIPDPDKNPLIQGLWEAPLIGWMKINPAFIASAITVALCSLWATLVNTALGVASIDKDHMNVARVLKLGFVSRLVKIIIPSALPLIFAGLRISLGVGWMVLIAAELLASSEGIGKFVWDQFNNGASDSFAKMMVVVFVVGVIGLMLDRIMIVFQRLVTFDGAPAAI